MAFRADEAARERHEEALHYLLFGLRELDRAERERSRMALLDIIEELGPVVDTYPSWHPLVRNHDRRTSCTLPAPECGYTGLDHTRFFRNGFITCPYGMPETVIDSVKALPPHPVATITAELLDVKLYHEAATPVIVKCEWDKSLEMDGTIPASIAIPLIIELEAPCWRWSQVAETWEAMRPYFLGRPHGSRSSLFVNQETGQTIKKVWNSLIYTGMFGPIKV